MQEQNHKFKIQEWFKWKIEKWAKPQRVFTDFGFYFKVELPERSKGSNIQQ